MIAEQKKWTKSEILNGRMPDCLESWRKIVDFIKQDEWLNTRALSDIATVKEWQRLTQKMNAQKGKGGKKMVI
jgi:ribulose 1,5-bisphosphate carboxylase large subunit-like protein